MENILVYTPAQGTWKREEKNIRFFFPFARRPAARRKYVQIRKIHSFMVQYWMEPQNESQNRFAFAGSTMPQKTAAPPEKNSFTAFGQNPNCFTGAHVCRKGKCNPFLHKAHENIQGRKKRQSAENFLLKVSSKLRLLQNTWNAAKRQSKNPAQTRRTRWSSTDASPKTARYLFGVRLWTCGVAIKPECQKACWILEIKTKECVCAGGGDST